MHVFLLKGNCCSCLVSNQLQGMSKLILGGGSNMLFVEDYQGLVIQNGIKGIEVLKEEEEYIWGESRRWRKLA